MKYTRLTKEQFENLSTEFSNFLASQQIDKEEWEKIKKETPQVAEEELDIFSDLIWEGALNNANYIEHYSKNHLFLFKFNLTDIEVIMIKSLDTSIDFFRKEGLNWLSDNVFTEKVEIRTGTKKFENERNIELFDIVKQGGILSNGEIYERFKKLLK